MKKNHTFMMVALFMASFYSVNAQTVVSTLAGLQSAVQSSNQTIEMTPGNYNVEDLSSGSRFFECTGSNNTIDLTGVYIEFPVGSGSSGQEHFLITGSNNTIMGGEFENTYSSGLVEVTDFVAYNNDQNNLASGEGPHIIIQGDGNSIIGTKLTVRGSYPYGYGSIYGIGNQNVFGLDKRAGIAVQGTNVTIDGCELQMRAFGHGIYIQSPADNTIVKNTLVEGAVRSGADMIADNDPTSLPSLSNFLDYGDDFDNPVTIDPTVVHSLCEDGIRVYSGGGSVTVENCTVTKMRGGIRLYLASNATVTNTTAYDNGIANWNMPTGGTVTNSSGNFAYDSFSDFRLSRNNIEAEWTIIPSPNASGPHNLMDVLGSGHTLVFHRSSGDYDPTTRAIVISGSNSVITNETEYPIILESTATGNTIYSCGPVTDNGSSNSVTQTTCSYDPVLCGGFDAFSTIEAEDYCDQSGIQTQTSSEGGENVGYIDSGDWLKFEDVDFGSGASSVDLRVASQSTGGTFELRLGSTSGSLIGSGSTSSTGGWQNWTTVSASISGASGTQDLYLVFTSGGINVNWIEFTASSSSGGFDAFSTIEAEDFSDMSGIQTQTSSEGGENVGFIDSGDWLKFEDVDFGSGASSVDLRVASQSTGGTFELRLGSTSGSLIGSGSTSSTGGWQNWTTVSASISGATGTQDLYLVFTSGGINVNWIEFTAGVTCATFSTIQAEDFDNMSGIVDEGSNIGFVEDGDWVMYSNIDLTCAASIDVRASSPNSGGDVEVRLGSATGSLIGTASVSNTGNWNSWSTFSANISSVSGDQDVYLVFTGGSGYLFNLDWIEFSSSSSSRLAEVSPEQTVLETELLVYPNPVSTNLTVVSHKSTYNQYSIYNIGGKIIRQDQIASDVTELSIDLNKFNEGVYILELKGETSVKRVKILKN